MTTETKAKYTPGPWAVVDQEFVDGPDGKGIFGGASTRRSDEENAANARLIAAAPELLEAAQTFLKWYFNDLVFGGVRDALRPDALRPLEAAVAKALGKQA